MPEAVRVRFAPSPTGVFHVGSARSALWNWLFARQHSGVFVLRIEDTDDARNEPQWVDGIRSAMRWLALEWDEEYLQSDNAGAHASAAARLYAEGRAYYCDCTPDDVKARKPEGAPPGYDGWCRDRQLEAAPGRALRFRIADGHTVIEDVVRGRVEFDNTKLGGDFVIAKGNGNPIFYLANTVDDIDERITHVLRGEEHLANAPKNQLLWQALAPEVPLPVWAHLPNLVNAQRKKLSKRRDRVSLESFREEGFLMEAVRNYLCLLGWAPQGDREFLTLEEMLAEFRLEDVGKSPAFFDVKKMTSFNEHYIRQLGLAEFIEISEPWLPPGHDPDVYARVAADVQPRVRTLAEIPGMVGFLFAPTVEIEDEAWRKAIAGNEVAPAILQAGRTAFAAIPWERSAIEDAVRMIADAQGLALSKAQAPIRAAVTGRTVGPPLWSSLEVLGRAPTLARIDAALGRLG